MKSDDELLDEIRRKEKSKLLFKGKLTSTYIASTGREALADLYKVKPATVSKSFRPSPVKTAMLLLFVCAVVYFLFQLQRIRPKPASVYVVVVVLVALLLFVAYQGYFNANRNYSIHLDFAGITIANEFYRWHDIRETGILRIGLGRGERYYLVIALKGGTYVRYNLFGFLTVWGFKTALSTYIEFFKKSA